MSILKDFQTALFETLSQSSLLLPNVGVYTVIAEDMQLPYMQCTYVEAKKIPWLDLEEGIECNFTIKVKTANYDNHTCFSILEAVEKTFANTLFIDNIKSKGLSVSNIQILQTAVKQESKNMFCEGNLYGSLFLERIE
jgi:hypothetical protein